MWKVQGGRMAALAGLAMVAGSMAVAGVARADGPTSVAVIPYAPLFGSVSGATADKATDQISQGLTASNSGNDFKVVAVAGSTSTETKAENGAEAAKKPLQAAVAQITKGADLVAKHRLKPAVTSLEHGISQFLANFQGADDFKPLSDGYAQLALAEILMGNDDKANQALDNLIRLDPERVLTTADVPKELVSRFNERRAALLSGSRGSIRIESNPPGARVSLDGKEVGATPLLGQQGIPGDHYVRVTKEGAGSAWKKVNISEDVSKVSFKLASSEGGTGPIADIRRGLGKNTIDDDLAKSIQQAGQDASVDYIVFGVVRKDADSGALEAHSFALRTKDAAISALPDLSFDEEMLGANIEVLKLVNDLLQKIQDQTFATSPGTLTAFEGVHAPAEEAHSGAPTVVVLAPDAGDVKSVESAAAPVEAGGTPRRHHGPVTAESDEPAVAPTPAPTPEPSESGDDNESILEKLRKRREQKKQQPQEKPAEPDTGTESGDNTSPTPTPSTDTQEEAPPPRRRHAEPAVTTTDSDQTPTDSGNPDQTSTDVTPSDQEKKVDLNANRTNSDYAALTPEDLEKMKQAESAAKGRSNNNTAIIWGSVGGAVGAAALAVAIYFIVTDTKAPSTATAHVTW